MLSPRDKTIGMLERVTWTHSVGRVLFAEENSSQPCVLVFAAHPDDDVLGVGITIYRHVLEGESARVVFTSNGGGHHRSRLSISVTAQTRYREACAALSKIGIPQGNVSCLGFPDGRLYRYMTDIGIDVKNIIEQTRPSRIYVHSIEGGHRDHDITGFVVQSVCRQIGYTEVYEWAEYNSLHTCRDVTVDFPPSPFEHDEPQRITMTPEEKVLKQEMLLAHISQVSDMRFGEFEGASEVVRHCTLDNLELKLKYFWAYSINSARLGVCIENFKESHNMI